MSRPRLIGIWAVGQDDKGRYRVIGREGDLPWRLPADLKRVKALTMGKPLIMGRKTFESLPKLLPGRRHIVLTHDKDWRADGAEVAHSPDEAIAIAHANGAFHEIIIFGGAQIYALFWDRFDRLETTLVHAQTCGDTFIPLMDQADWDVHIGDHFETEGERPAFTFHTLTRPQGWSAP